MQYISPKYSIYQDEDFIRSVKNGPVDDVMLNAFVRDQVSMMKSDAMSQKQRKPRGCDIEEMGKALIIKFPNLNYADKNRGHVS